MKSKQRLTYNGVKVSMSFLFNYIMARASWFSMRWWWDPLCTNQTNTLSWIFIVVAYWNNSPRIDMLSQSDTSSVSGPYNAIDPYVKPFFPPDPPQMTALYEFLSYCLRVFHVLITSRYDFSFNHVFSCPFNFLMANCSFC